MSMCARALVLAVLGLLSWEQGTRAAAGKEYNLTIGYLPSLTGELRNRQGLAISGALAIALEELNNSTEYLPDVKLLLEWHDTESDTVRTTRLLIDMVCGGVVAFFGPEGRCDTEAIIAQSRNLPMISYRCADNQASTLSNFVRMETTGQATKSAISLLRYYRWNKFSIVYEESWGKAVLALENDAKKNNMTVNHRLPVMDGFKCCEEKLTCCAPGFWYQVIRDTKKETRIYVFLGSTAGLNDMMTAMESQQLFAKGEYMVIFVDMMSYTPRQGLNYLIKTEDFGIKKLTCPNTPEFKKRAQSLLVVASSEPSSGYQEFANRVRQYNNKAGPFYFPALFGNKFISIYAAHLYDSVRLYAMALDSLIKEDTVKEKLTYAKLLNIATNGSRIVARIIESSPYESISGLPISFDERGDAEGNFCVLAFKLAHINDEYLNCSYNMVPVGHFQKSSKGFPREFPYYHLNPRLPIDWPDYVKPDDEPACGFLDDKCH